MIKLLKLPTSQNFLSKITTNSKFLSNPADSAISAKNEGLNQEG